MNGYCTECKCPCEVSAEKVSRCPDCGTPLATETHLRFLDVLRDDGKINMFGAARYLHEMFPELSKTAARDITTHWMKTFGERHQR